MGCNVECSHQLHLVTDSPRSHPPIAPTIFSPAPALVGHPCIQAILPRAQGAGRWVQQVSGLTPSPDWDRKVGPLAGQGRGSRVESEQRAPLAEELAGVLRPGVDRPENGPIGGSGRCLMPPPHWLARGFSPQASSFSSSVERGTKG